MDFKGYQAEKVFNSDNTVAYEQYVMVFEDKKEKE